MSDRRGKDYDVGYGKPPKSTRWKMGQSGNPSGRPKKPKDVTSIVERIAQETVRVRGVNGETEISSQEAVYRKQIEAACKGDQRAVAWLIREIKRCKLIVPKIAPQDEPKVGLLVVPGPTTLPIEEWRARYNKPVNDQASSASSDSGRPGQSRKSS